jgi:hypothetical protein
MALLVPIGLLGACATPIENGPAWYCTAGGQVGDVYAFSTMNLNADGTTFYASRDWQEQLLEAPTSVYAFGRGDRLEIAIMHPMSFTKDVYRTEIRIDSADRPQLDPALTHDDPRNGSNSYSFKVSDVLRYRGHQMFFVALDRSGRAILRAPFDGQAVDRGAQAMAMASAKLAEMRANFRKRCVSRAKADVILT